MTAPDRPAAVARRLPGTARPRAEVLREFEESNAKLRQGLAPVLWTFFAPGAGDFFRWRVQLECGCIREVMTHGCDRLPDQVCWPDPLSRRPLPECQILCPQPYTPPAPYQTIASFDHRREVSFDPDLVDPPDWVDADIWAVIRRDHPSTKAFWSVTLSCGHVIEVVCDPDWKPADGPRRVPAQRQAAMIAEFEEYFASGPADLDVGWREHMRRILADGFRCHARSRHVRTARKRKPSSPINEWVGSCRDPCPLSRSSSRHATAWKASSAALTPKPNACARC